MNEQTRPTKFYNSLAIDKFTARTLSVNYSVARWQTLRTVIATGMLFLVPFFTDMSTQGLWYFFISIGALSSIAEMGFCSLFIVFSSHENSEIKQRNTSASANHTPPFSYFVLLWSLGIGALFFPLLTITGAAVLTYKSEPHSWEIPWIMYSYGIAMTLTSNFLLAWYEGQGNIKNAYMLRTLITAITILVAAAFLWTGFGLWALPLSQVSSSLVPLILLLPQLIQASQRRSFTSRDVLQHWLPQVLPLLKRNAGSFIGGYIVFQAATIMAYLDGSTETAGTVGFTTSAWMAGFSVFYSFLASSTASAGSMWAQGRGQEAIQKCFSAWKQSLMLFLAAGLCAIGIILLFPHFSLFQRMTSAGHMFIFFVGLALHLGVAAIAILFRSAKQEPFTKISLLTALICIAIVALSSHLQWSLYWGFLVANAITLIYCKKFLDTMIVDLALTEKMGEKE